MINDQFSKILIWSLFGILGFVLMHALFQITFFQTAEQHSMMAGVNTLFSLVVHALTFFAVTLSIGGAAVYFHKNGVSQDEPFAIITEPGDLPDLKDVGQKTQELYEINISARNMTFEPKLIIVEQGAKVKLTFINEEDVVTNFVIEGLDVKTGNLDPKTEQALEFTAHIQGEFDTKSTESPMKSRSGKFIVRHRKS